MCRYMYITPKTGTHRRHKASVLWGNQPRPHRCLWRPEPSANIFTDVWWGGYYDKRKEKGKRTRRATPPSPVDSSTCFFSFPMGGLWHVVVFYARCLSIIMRGTPPFSFRPEDYSDFSGLKFKRRRTHTNTIRRKGGRVRGRTRGRGRRRTTTTTSDTNFT